MTNLMTYLLRVETTDKVEQEATEVVRCQCQTCQLSLPESSAETTSQTTIATTAIAAKVEL